ncbi:helix-turn-helix domain-containing protein [Labedaea rhizosphaerae]|uniref:helix-turn-helix domain-containing protein n=1 Tax=Labedaea rhizosphaerae TaxID=598644 RepID=UPI001414DEAA|nr:helix-turn-helix transcriptional regulator [Labedaea rhizosphaerae]
MKLAELLADLRKKKKFTQAEAAAELGCRQPKINKIETVQTVVKASDVSKLLAIYEATNDQVAEAGRLLALTRPGPNAGARPNPLYLKMVSAESEASEILVLHSERIPSLLQSDYYMLCQYRAANDPTDETLLMETREERESLLSQDNELRKYRIVLGESSLRRMPGGRSEITVDQAEHLLNLMERHERLELRICTYEAPIPFMPTDVTILRLTGDQKDLVYLENGISGRIYDGKDVVTEHLDLWQMVYDAALSVDGSKKFLRDLITECHR